MAQYEDYGKKNWDDGSDDMKAHRIERKYRGHKLAVAVGQNKLQRQINDELDRKRV